MEPLIDYPANGISGNFIVPGNKVKKLNAATQLDADVTLLSVVPHMHLIGTRLKVYALNPINKNDTIRIVDSRWNFMWQGMYTFLNPIKLSKGFIIVAEGTYDNTSNNPNNPHSPPKDFLAGNSTLTEMLQVFFCFTGDVKNTPAFNLNVSIDEKNSSNIQFDIFPNPVQSNQPLHVKLPKDGKYSVSLMTLEGKELVNFQKVQSQDNQSDVILDMPSINNGIYLLRMTSSEGSFYQKVIVE